MSMVPLVVLLFGAIAVMKRDFGVHAALAPNELRFATQLRHPPVNAAKAYVYRPIDSAPLKRYRHLSCPAAAMDSYRPICAWAPASQHQRTFANECEMHRVARLTSTQWISIRNGVCQTNTEEKMKRHSSKAQQGETVRRAIPCPKVFNPVCAVLQGVKSTFPNECLVNAENIKTGKEWQILSSDVCAEDHELRDEIKKIHSISRRSVRNAHVDDLKLQHTQPYAETNYGDYSKQNSPFDDLPYDDDIDNLAIFKKPNEILKEIQYGEPLISFSNNERHHEIEAHPNNIKLINYILKWYIPDAFAPHKEDQHNDYERFMTTPYGPETQSPGWNEADKFAYANEEYVEEEPVESGPESHDQFDISHYKESQRDAELSPTTEIYDEDPKSYASQSASQLYDSTDRNYAEYIDNDEMFDDVFQTNTEEIGEPRRTNGLLQTNEPANIYEDLQLSYVKKRQVPTDKPEKEKSSTLQVPNQRIVVSHSGRLRGKPKIEYKPGEAIITFSNAYPMDNSGNAKVANDTLEMPNPHSKLNDYRDEKENQTSALAISSKKPAEADNMVEDCVFGNGEVCARSGSKYLTFVSICDLMLRNVFEHSKWTVVHEGNCHNCSRHCGKKYEPICATRNGINVTFVNECLMQEEICNNKASTWRILGKDECLNLMDKKKNSVERAALKSSEKSRRQAKTAAVSEKTPDKETTTSSWVPLEFTLPRMLRIQKRTSTTTMQPPTTTPMPRRRYKLKSKQNVAKPEPDSNVMSLLRPMYYPWQPLRKPTSTDV